jgi:hypothetical protein
VSRSQIRDAITTISERRAVTMLLMGGVQIADEPIDKSPRTLSQWWQML